MKTAPILICYDGSGDAKRAIGVAAEVLGPRSAVLLDVGPVLTPVESYAVMASFATGADFEQVNEDDALTRAREGVEVATRAGFDATARGVTAGTTWKGILDVADEIDAEAIVIGSRGLTGVREFAEGSLSHEVTKHSTRPVLVVPPARRRG